MDTVHCIQNKAFLYQYNWVIVHATHCCCALKLFSDLQTFMTTCLTGMQTFQRNCFETGSHFHWRWTFFCEKKQIFSEFSLSVSTEATLTWWKFKQGMRYFTYVAFCKTWLWLQRKYECNYIWKQMMSAFLCPSIHDRWYKPRPTH